MVQSTRLNQRSIIREHPLAASIHPCQLPVDIVRPMSYTYNMIIFDASTLILLARIDLLELFVSTFAGRILIPKKVKAEVCREGKEETPLINRLIKEGRVEVLPVKDRRAVRKLEKDFALAAGEAEALMLAIEHNVSLIATDDRNAIRGCKVLKLEFTTALAFLVRAFEKMLIDRNEAISRLDKLESIARYKQAIISDVKQKLQGVGNGD